MMEEDTLELSSDTPLHDLGDVARNIVSLAPQQCYVYDYLHEEPILNTVVFPAHAFSDSVQERRECNGTLTHKEIGDLLDVALPSGTSKMQEISNLFCKMVRPFLTASSAFDPNQFTTHDNLHEILRRLKIQIIYDINMHGSCLFRCIDFCLGGHKDLSKVNGSSIKVEMVSHMLNGLHNNQLDHAIVAQYIQSCAPDFEKQLSEQFRTLNTFKKFVRDHDKAYRDDEITELWDRISYNRTPFSFDLSSDKSVFEAWLSSDSGVSVLPHSEFLSLREAGVFFGGIILMGGFLNEWYEGSELELSLVPKIFGKSVILIDVDAPKSAFGLGLQMRSTGDTMYVTHPILSTALASTHIYLCPESSPSTFGANEPMLLMRSAGHYVVCATTDGGTDLNYNMRLGHIYHCIIDIHNETVAFMRRILDHHNEPEPTSWNPQLSHLATKYMNDYHKSVTSMLIYEKTRFQLAFCKLLLFRTFDHDPAFIRTFRREVDRLNGDCRFVNPSQFAKEALKR